VVLNAIEHNIELRLLGTFSLSIGGAPIPPLRTRKGQWLLALLALRDGRAVDRSWLAGMLWPDSLEEQSLCNLRRALTDLRSALGPAADRICAPTPRTLSLDLHDDDTVDLYLFKRLVEIGETSALEQATALYSGSLLEGCDEHWVHQERLATEISYLTAMENLASRFHDDSRFDDAISLLKKVISIDPLRETARRHLMHSYAAAGNISNAVLAYREFRELVRRELNSVPDAETTELYQKIRAGVDQMSNGTSDQPARTDTLRPVNAQGRLPRPLSALIGRATEILDLEQALSTNRLITLVGAGGIGKTRLAIQAAETALEQFPDGAWFADLSGIRDSDMLASFVASSLEIPEDAAESPRGFLSF
jgi:DNA-binding SARP family transcriptional activator